MLVHKDLKHRKSFEKTQLGSLPQEILIMILGYVVPDCNKCFLQRDLLKLGSVCKKLNELVKISDLYKEINLSGECCPGTQFNRRNKFSSFSLKNGKRFHFDSEAFLNVS